MDEERVVMDLPKIIHITKGPKDASVNWCGAPSDPNWPEDDDFKFALTLPICHNCIEEFDGDTLVLRKSTAAVTRTVNEAVDDGFILDDELMDVTDEPYKSSIMDLGKSPSRSSVGEYSPPDSGRQKSLRECAA